MKRLHFIYTIPRFYDQLYRPVMSEAFDGRDDLEVRFTMDNSLLLDTLAANVIPTPAVKRRLLHLAESCAASGADCIVVGCTAVNTATKEIAKVMDIPLLSVDEPMIQSILADGRKRVAVLSHSPINASTIKRRLLAEDPSMEVELFPTDGAEQAFQKGNLEEFGRLMRQNAEQIPESFDALILGHISAERLDLSHCAVPVYRTGECCIREIHAILKGEKTL